MATKKAAAKVATPAKTAQAVEVKKVNVRVNDAARIKAGQYAGLVGSVQAISEDGGRAKCLVQGMQNGEPVDVLEWFGADSLEPNK